MGAGSEQCPTLAWLGGLALLCCQIKAWSDTESLLDGEERAFLPDEDLRLLPGDGANALHRLAAPKLNPNPTCLHVENPTALRPKRVLNLRSRENESSPDARSLVPSQH